MPQGQGAFRTSLVIAIAAAVLLAAPAARAAIFDPGADWKTIETKHFRVHFPGRVEDVARRAARICEEVYPRVTEKWHWKPWSYTEVVLADNTDDSNGLSSVLPYNWMFLFVAPPDPDSSLAHYDDWLTTLITHEFTHIVQIDAIGGFWWPLRLIVGKTVAPSGINPTWIREGVAQYDETVMTQGGRGRGAYSEMVVRTAILEDAFLRLDQADGLSWKWPGFKGAYVYGIKFLQFLIDTYGEEKFLEFDRRVRSSPMLAMINHQARDVYGKTFYELWNEWERSLKRRYAEQTATLTAKGLTDTTPVVVQRRDEQYADPALSPGGDKLAFAVGSPHTKSEIRMLDLASGEMETLKRGQAPSQLSWSRDGTKIAYAAMGGYKTYNRSFDLWLYDFDVEKVKKRARRITRGERGRDPDFDPSGASIVFVASDKGTDTLKRIDIASGDITVITPSVPRGMQFANPRFSPDGRFIAVSVWRPGDGWRIYRYRADGSDPVRLTQGTGLVVESRPAWAPDGRSVLFSSDEGGIDNIFRVPADGGQQLPVSNVLTGLFQPTVAPDGKIYAQIYRATGFEIASFTPAPAFAEPVEKKKRRGMKDERRGTRDEGRGGGPQSPTPPPPSAVGIDQSPPLPLPTETEKKKAATGRYAKMRGSRHAEAGQFIPPLPAGTPEEIEASFTPHKYVAFSHSLFLPRFIMPSGGILDNAIFVALTTGGADPLRWHNWMASANYRTDAKHFGYNIAYWYNRWRPIFGAWASDFAVDYGKLTFVTFNPDGTIASSNTVHYFEHRKSISAYMAIPIQKHSFSISYFFEDHTPFTSLTPTEQSALNLGHFAGFRGEYRYGDWERYPASISPENGRQIRLTGSITNTRFGSGHGNSQEIFSGDWREFVLLGSHQVLALRAAGGITWGDRLVQGTFGLGGSLGEGSFGAGGSYNYFPLRGLPVSALSRTRAMLFSAEYRFPMLNVLRGIGTVPLFLKDIDGAIFADYGDAWNAHEIGSDSLRHFFGQFLLGVGAELRANIVVGHGLPIHGRLGYGIIVLNRGRLGGLTDPILGQNVKYGILILALGSAF